MVNHLEKESQIKVRVPTELKHNWGGGGGGSRAGCIKKTDPYKGTGANNQWEMKCVYKRHLIPI